MKRILVKKAPPVTLQPSPKPDRTKVGQVAAALTDSALKQPR